MSLSFRQVPRDIRLGNQKREGGSVTKVVTISRADQNGTLTRRSNHFEARLLFLRQWKVITPHTIVKTVSRSQLTGASAGARLLKRVFDVDVEHCPNCGGALKIIAAIEDPPVIAKILSHLGPADPRPAACAGASSRSIPDDLRSRKPPANASRRRRSL